MPLKTSQDEPPALNLTPMIDVVFLLIIFFMVGTKFSELERKISLQLPQLRSAAEPLSAAPAKRVVEVHRDGQIMLEREAVSLAELTSVLSAARAEYADLGVLVRGDADGPFQNVADVLGACREAGIAEMGISVRLSGQNPATFR